jgi:hypothetical protein
MGAFAPVHACAASQLHTAGYQRLLLTDRLLVVPLPLPLLLLLSLPLLLPQT